MKKKKRIKIIIIAVLVVAVAAGSITGVVYYRNSKGLASVMSVSMISTTNDYTSMTSEGMVCDDACQTINLKDGQKVTEVYVTKYLFNNENIKGINYGNSNYILTEFPYNATFSDNSYEMLDRLMSEQGLIPVIPHVERYSFLVDNPDVNEVFFCFGVVSQTYISN